LPNKATWDDLMCQIYVRQANEAGLKDSDEGRTVEVKEVRKRFGLTK
jgi:predicted transcriptional regulator